MSESDKTTGYKRGLRGDSSSSRNWLEPHNSESAKDRRAGYEQGRRDRARIEAENKKK